MWNNIHFVLAVFNDNLFISSHSFILNSSAFVKKSGSVFWGLARYVWQMQLQCKLFLDNNRDAC